MEKNKVYYMHTSKLPLVKSGFSKPCTIAITLKGDHFYYGVSVCHRNDNFCRKTGRELAERRLIQEFGRIPVPVVVHEKQIPDSEACLGMLASLTGSVAINPYKYERRIHKFNQERADLEVE